MRIHTSILVTAAAVAFVSPAFAAIGCTLGNPAADLKHLYPEMTSYREVTREFRSFKDGPVLYEKLATRVGKLDPIYEAYETPYTLYSVFNGEKRVGFVHGVNVPGSGGVIQLFVATEPETAKIRTLFFQRLESPASKALRDKAFRARFTGVTLGDFYRHEYYAVAEPGAKADTLSPLLKAPAELTGDGAADFSSAMRGLYKNLLLLDILAYDMRHEPFYERARTALAAREKTPPAAPERKTP